MHFRSGLSGAPHGGCSRGRRCASPPPHCVHTRERPPARLPSLLASALAPSRPLGCSLPPGGRGRPGPRRGAAAPGRLAERGARPAPRARANLGELWPQFAPRHSLSGAFSTPALAPAGAVERRAGLPSPLDPFSRVRGGRACGVPAGGGRDWGGSPHRGARPPQFRAGSGVHGLPVSDSGRAFPIRSLSASPTASCWSLCVGGHPSPPPPPTPRRSGLVHRFRAAEPT